MSFWDKIRFIRKPFREPKKPAGEKKEAPRPTAEEISQPAQEETGEAYRILLRPLVTEKGARLAPSGQYLFLVDPRASKITVARAIEKVYGVRPASVNVVRMKGKVVRFARTLGQQKSWKKAIVTLPPGKKIRVYEGV